jgi:hypothetical protein
MGDARGHFVGATRYARSRRRGLAIAPSFLPRQRTGTVSQGQVSAVREVASLAVAPPMEPVLTVRSTVRSTVRMRNRSAGRRRSNTVTSRPLRQPESAALWGQAAFCPWRDANTSVNSPLIAGRPRRHAGIRIPPGSRFRGCARGRPMAPADGQPRARPRACRARCDHRRTETAVTVLRERAEVAEQRADDAVTMAERTLG